MAQAKTNQKKKPNNGANVGYEAELWQMADALRGSMDAAEYKHVVLGLIFLKYISDAFEEQHAKLEAEKAQGADPEDPDEYRALNIFWVPPEARWWHLKAHFIDGFARHMRDALPNASFIGFTGTPIELTDKNTRAVFGDYISIYDIQRAVEDKATVPIYYESRLAKLELDEAERPKIDPDFEEATEGEEIDRKEKLKSKWAQLEAVVGAGAYPGAERRQRPLRPSGARSVALLLLLLYRTTTRFASATTWRSSKH
jgi:hypothetical protein